MQQPSTKAEPVALAIRVPAELRVRMIQLGISPARVAKKAFEQEIKRKEELERLARAKQSDPRIALEDIRRPTKRTKRLLGD